MSPSRSGSTRLFRLGVAVGVVAMLMTTGASGAAHPLGDRSLLPTSPGRQVGAASPTTGPLRAFKLPAYDGRTGVPGMAMTGARVVGDPTTGCVWVGSHMHKVAALWPERYTARFLPLRIYDDKGRVVWTEFDEPRRIGGGHSRVFVRRIPQRCRVGPTAWWVA